MSHRTFTGSLGDGESELIQLKMLIDDIGFQISSDEAGTLEISYLEIGASGFIVLTSIQDSGIISDLMAIDAILLKCAGGTSNWLLRTRQNMVNTARDNYQHFRKNASHGG